MSRHVRFIMSFFLLAVLLLPTRSGATAPAARSAPNASYSIGGFLTYRSPTAQPVCAAGFQAEYFNRQSCGFIVFTISPAAADKTIVVDFIGPDGTVIESDTATARDTVGEYDVQVMPDAAWPAGRITAVMRMSGGDTGDGSTSFYHNVLEVLAQTDQPNYASGDSIGVSGSVAQLNTVAANQTTRTPIAATVVAHLLDVDGTILDSENTTANGLNGTYSMTFANVVQPDGIYYVKVDAIYTDPSTGTWLGTSQTPTRIGAEPASNPMLQASFTSSLGTVRPGDTYLYTIDYSNTTQLAQANAVLSATLPAYSAYVPQGTSPAPSSVAGQTLTWSLGTLQPGTGGRIFLYARAFTQQQERTIVWRPLNLTAQLTAGSLNLTSTSHGPKVVPAGEVGDSARFGDRPFPVVLVEYTDLKHAQQNTGAYFDQLINDATPGARSLFNRFQEMSFGQLFPNGVVPSLGKGAVAYSETPDATYRWSTLQPAGFCSGTTTAGATGNPADPDGPPLLATNRIVNEWYQLPGTQGYYGSDSSGNNYAGALTGQAALVNVDNGCGPTGKLAYDAATLADPDIDYNDFDTDRDGWVDFFEIVYSGAPQNVIGDTGANNIWPHSSSIGYYYIDGYTSNDRLRDHQDRPLFWTDDSHTGTTLSDTGMPAYVRVGPYNVNAEFSDETTFSHEYGHSLGMPDNYSLGTRETMGEWDLMASSEGHMSMWDKQELGWIVPFVITDSTNLDVNGIEEQKQDINRIEWRDHTGQLYTLSGPEIHNAEVYKVDLPGRQLFDPALIPSGRYLYYSGSGNDFGFPGHTLDIAFDANMTEGAADLTLQFRSWYEIEKDYDYGYVLVSTDGGATFSSLPSEQGTTGNTNPNGNNRGNGITCNSGGQSSTYCTAGVGTPPEPVFITDTYDLSSYAGEDFILRFAYSTDPGLAMRGWLIDDLALLDGTEVLYFDDAERVRQDGRYVLNGWTRANGTADAEHAYWIGLRDNSGFDALASFAPGVVVEYADEAHGYGNVGVDNPPALTVLDSQPEPGSDTPNLNDAAFTAANGDNLFTDCDDPTLSPGARHVDNYSDPNGPDGEWVFGFRELRMQVTRVSGSPPTADVSFTRAAPCGGELLPTVSGPENVAAGQTFSYRIDVRKLGEDPLTNAVISDTLDARLTFVSASDGGTLEGDTVVWELGTLTPEVTRTLTLTVTLSPSVEDGDIIENVADSKADGLPVRHSNTHQARVSANRGDVYMPIIQRR